MKEMRPRVELLGLELCLGTVGKGLFVFRTERESLSPYHYAESGWKGNAIELCVTWCIYLFSRVLGWARKLNSFFYFPIATIRCSDAYIGTCTYTCLKCPRHISISHTHTLLMRLSPRAHIPHPCPLPPTTTKISTQPNPTQPR